jgi:hypothetical protein
MHVEMNCCMLLVYAYGAERRTWAHVHAHARMHGLAWRCLHACSTSSFLFLTWTGLRIGSCQCRALSLRAMVRTLRSRAWIHRSRR